MNKSLVLIAVLFASSSYAKWENVADQWEGYRLNEQQKNAMGYAHNKRPGPRCCDFADGLPVDAALREDGWYVPNIENPHAEWIKVPEDAFVDGSNPVGVPIVWWTAASPKEIRCFWPGPGT